MTSAANGPVARVTLNAFATMAGAGFLLLRGKAAGTARMENFRAFDESADFAGEDEPAMEAPPEIGIDERRMHVRAYNYWVSLLAGRPYPSIPTLEPPNLADFGPHRVIAQFPAA